MARQILWLREQIGWMGKHSGYDLLCEYLSRQYGEDYHSIWIDRKKKPSPIYRPLLGATIKRGKTCLPTYDKYLAVAELQAAWESWRRGGLDLLHVMYVERDYGVMRRWGRRFFKHIIGTVHQPDGLWRMGRHNPRVLSSLDAIVTPSSNTLAYFEQYLPGRAFFIPHGVDIDFFSPPPAKAINETVRCIFCGVWLRDIPTLARTIDLVLDRNPSIGFDLVVPEQARNNDLFYRIARHPQVSWHGNLSDEQLRSLYRQASLLFLPLTDSTANNALLEAISTGLPIVSNAVGGLHDYTQDSFAELLPVGDVEGLSEAILRLADDPQERVKRGMAARGFAEENLDWSAIAARTMEVYSKVCQW